MSGARPAGNRLAVAALGFALAGALASWNPFAAPFGLIVGAAAAFLAARALLRKQGSRPIARIALALGILDGLASLVMLIASTGLIYRPLTGQHVVKTRTPAEQKALLDSAAAESAEARARASRELEELGVPPRKDGGTRADAGGLHPDEPEQPAGRAQE